MCGGGKKEEEKLLASILLKYIINNTRNPQIKEQTRFAKHCVIDETGDNTSQREN